MVHTASDQQGPEFHQDHSSPAQRLTLRTDCRYVWPPGPGRCGGAAFAIQRHCADFVKLRTISLTFKLGPVAVGLTRHGVIGFDHTPRSSTPEAHHQGRWLVARVNRLRALPSLMTPGPARRRLPANPDRLVSAERFPSCPLSLQPSSRGNNRPPAGCGSIHRHIDRHVGASRGKRLFALQPRHHLREIALVW